MSLRKTLLLPTLLLCCQLSAWGQGSALKNEIESLVANRELKLGFALYDFSSGQTISIHGDDKFPMQSVYKFPIGVALLEEVSQGKFSLCDSLEFTKDDLSPNLWSPIRERWPEGVRLPIKEVLTYMVAHSDNSATDMLIRKIGSPDSIQQIIQRLGAKDIYIRNTEQEIQAQWSVQFDNWSTPNAMILFLRRMNEGQLLNKENTQILWDIMTQTSNGATHKRVPPTLVFARKTGYSGANPQGMIAAQNDVGIIELENGQRLAYAIFLTDSRIGTDAGYDLIAQIGLEIWKAYGVGF